MAAAPLVVFLVALLTTSIASVSSERIDINWDPNVNQTAWAEQHRFHVGDWLNFIYKKDMYDVLEVNATAFNKCLADAPLLNYSRGHNFVYRLNQSRWYYFITSKGFCWGMMKLAVFAEPLTAHQTSPQCSPVPAATDPSLKPTGASSSAFVSGGLDALMCAVIAGALALAGALRLL